MKRRLFLSVSLIAQSALGAQVPGTLPVARASALFEAARYEEARSALASVAAGNAEAMYLLGRIALVRREHDAAVEQLEHAVERDTGDALHAAWLGRAYGEQARAANPLRQAMIASRARDVLERAVTMHPEHIEARKALSEFYAVAPAILGGGKAKAREQATEVKRRNQYEGLLMMAWVLADGNDPEGAERELVAAAGLYPDSIAVVRALANVYLTRLRRPADALGLVNAYLVRHAADPVAQYLLGVSAFGAGTDLDAAQKALTQYLAYAPRHGEPTLAAAHYRLGLIAQKRGDRDGARRELEAALRLDPGLEAARTALKGV